MFCSRNTRTAYSSIPASTAATSSGRSGFRQSTPATSPTKTGWSGRIETGISVSLQRLAPCHRSMHAASHLCRFPDAPERIRSHVLVLLFLADPAEPVHIDDDDRGTRRPAVDAARSEGGDGRGRSSLLAVDPGRRRLLALVRRSARRCDTHSTIRGAAWCHRRALGRLPEKRYPGGTRQGGTDHPRTARRGGTRRAQSR